MPHGGWLPSAPSWTDEMGITIQVPRSQRRGKLSERGTFVAEDYMPRLNCGEILYSQRVSFGATSTVGLRP